MGEGGELGRRGGVVLKGLKVENSAEVRKPNTWIEYYRQSSLHNKQ